MSLAQSYDLIIVGAGIVGSACAHAASLAGMRVAIIEPDAIGGGATGAGMGHLVALDEDPDVFALARDSMQRWAALRALPQAEYLGCGTLWLAEDLPQWQHLIEKAHRLQDAGVTVELFDGRGLQRIEPSLARDLMGGLRVPEEGVVYPPAVARWQVEQACAHGARLIHGRRVKQVRAFEARLDDGERLLGPVLVAAGLDSARLLDGLPMRARRGHLIVTERHPELVRHQLVEAGYSASVGSTGSSVAFNLQPRPTRQLLVGSSRELGIESARSDRGLMARMLQRALRFVPALARMRVLRCWTGLRPASIDGKPYIGPWPSIPGIHVATGHEGLGITTALGSAALFMDLLLGHTPCVDPRAFCPSRVLTCA